MPARTEPSRQQLAAIGIAAVQNCADLLDDAELLLRAHRFARAHALAAFAFEEFGKYWLTIASLVHPGEPEYWAAYHADFTDHITKLRYARIGLHMVESNTFGPADRDRLHRWARSEHVRKMDGIYVGLRNGDVVRPREAIQREEAERLIADVKLVLEVGRLGAAALEGVSREGWAAFDAMLAADQADDGETTA